jgi:hypothetical protein
MTGYSHGTLLEAMLGSGGEKAEIYEYLEKILSNINVDENDFKKILSSLADDYDSWFIEWIRENCEAVYIDHRNDEIEINWG